MNIPNNFYFFNISEKREEVINNQYAICVRAGDLKCHIDESCINDKDERTRNIIANCIYMFLKKNPFFKNNYYWQFIYLENNDWLVADQKINVWTLMKDYPKTVGEKITRILENLSENIRSMGESLNVDFSSENPRAYLPESDNASIDLIEEQLQDAGFFDVNKQTITIKGWKRIENQTRNKNSKKIFIASKFDGYEDVIDTIKNAIKEAKYEPICMTDYQTNDYIMPEIFKQIKESVAVVGEISSGSNGVYFELGFAKGLGIDTIVVSKKEIDEKTVKAHFDVAQISIIYYKDLEELKKNLIYRIKSTLL